MLSGKCHSGCWLTNVNLFSGEIIHSVDYKCAISNGFVGKRVLIVGIGNSAVDAAANAITEGR